MRLSGAIALAAALACSSALAHARTSWFQDADDWSTGHADMSVEYLMRPPVFMADEERDAIAGDLGLDEAERAAFGAIVEGAEEEFRSIWLDAQERLHKEARRVRREGGLAGSIRWVGACVVEPEAARRALLDRVFDDLALILDEDGSAALHRVHRDHRRRTTLAEASSVQGDTVDLGALAAEAWQVRGADLTEELEAYNAEIDLLLDLRDRAARRLEELVADRAIVWRTMRPGYGPGNLRGETRELASDAAFEVARACERIAMLNLRSLEPFADAIPDEAARAAFRERAERELAAPTLTPPTTPLRRAIGSLLAGRPAHGLARAGFLSEGPSPGPPSSLVNAPAPDGQTRRTIEAMLVERDAAVARVRDEYHAVRARLDRVRFARVDTGVVRVTLSDWLARLDDADDDDEDGDSSWTAWWDYLHAVAALDADLLRRVREALSEEQRIALVSFYYASDLTR